MKHAFIIIILNVVTFMFEPLYCILHACTVTCIARALMEWHGVSLHIPQTRAVGHICELISRGAVACS